jgi:hypothetical protein
VRELQLVPDAVDPTRQWAELLVDNARGGDGQAQVTVRLEDLDGGGAWVSSENVDLKDGEKVRVRLHLPRKPGRYRLAAEARYPPD